MSRVITVFKGIFRFLVNRQAWWLVPILVLLAIVALLILFGQSAVLSPIVYALF